jgi:penicillin-binding protein 1A
MEIPNGAGNWRMGLVLGMDRNGSAVVGHADGTWDLLTLDGVRWARRVTARGLGNPPRRVDEVVRTGDVILVSREGNRLELRQIPEIQGSAIIMEASSGRVLGVAGGFDSEMGRFNRATQGRRQPGSTFKTLTYMAAFEAGYDPTSPVLDSPIALDTGPNQRWRPEGGGAMGLITLRRALELSRNLSSVRLLNDIGIEAVSDLSRRLGVYDRPLTNFAAGLGAVETTNMRLTAAYASIVNGGFRVNPGFVDEVLDQSGRVLWSRNRERERVLDPIASAQMVSVLEGVVRRGTGAAVLGRLQLPIAGKTGTTNDNHDAWFVGFTPEYAIGVHIGYDRPRDMGSLETGGRAAAPIFGDIARGVLSIRPGPTEFPLPHGAEVQRIDPVTGEQSRNGIPEIRRRP